MKTKIFFVYILAVVNALGYVDHIHVSVTTYLSEKGSTLTDNDNQWFESWFTGPDRKSGPDKLVGPDNLVCPDK